MIALISIKIVIVINHLMTMSTMNSGDNKNNLMNKSEQKVMVLYCISYECIWYFVKYLKRPMYKGIIC